MCVYVIKPATRLRLGEVVTNGGHSMMLGACGLVRADGSCRRFSAYMVLPLNVTAFDLPPQSAREAGAGLQFPCHRSDGAEVDWSREMVFSTVMNESGLANELQLPSPFCTPRDPFPIRGVTGLRWRKNYLKRFSCLIVEPICGSWSQKDLSLNDGTAI